MDAFVGKHVEVIVEEDESTNIANAGDLAVPIIKRRFGTLAGKLEASEDFDQPMPPDLQRYFEGEADE